MNNLDELLARGWESVKSFTGNEYFRKPGMGDDYNHLTLDEAYGKEFGDASQKEK